MGIGKGFMRVPLVQPRMGYYPQVEAFVFVGIQGLLGHKDPCAESGTEGRAKPERRGYHGVLC